MHHPQFCSGTCPSHQLVKGWTLAGKNRHTSWWQVCSRSREKVVLTGISFPHNGGRNTRTLMKATILSYPTLFEIHYHTVHYLSCFTLVSKQGLKVYFNPQNTYLQDFCHDFAYHTGLYVHLLQILVYSWSNNYILNTVHNHKLVVDFIVINIHKLRSYVKEML